MRRERKGKKESVAPRPLSCVRVRFAEMAWSGTTFFSPTWLSREIDNSAQVINNHMRAHSNGGSCLFVINAGKNEIYGWARHTIKGLREKIQRFIMSEALATTQTYNVDHVSLHQVWLYGEQQQQKKHPWAHFHSTSLGRRHWRPCSSGAQKSSRRPWAWGFNVDQSGDGVYPLSARSPHHKMNRV